MRHSSRCTQYINTGMVYWLNVDNWKMLSHNINCAVSLIPGLNKYFLLPLFVSLDKLGGRDVRVTVRVSCNSNLLTLYSMIETVNIF